MRGRRVRPPWACWRGRWCLESVCRRTATRFFCSRCRGRSSLSSDCCAPWQVGDDVIWGTSQTIRLSTALGSRPFFRRTIIKTRTFVSWTDYIHTCRSYVFHVFGSQRVIVVNVVGVARALADSSDFGLLGEQSSQKCEIPCLERRWTAVKNLTPLALSSRRHPQPHKVTQKQTVTDISRPCLSACVDNETHLSYRVN